MSLIGKNLLIALGAFAYCGLAQAQSVTATEPWARATVAGQQVGGVFVTLTSDTQATLVSATSPVAERVEIHEMATVQGVMRMRPIDALPLPKGQAVALKPGGHHLMLIGLKAPLTAGQNVPITLTLRTDAKQTFTQTVNAFVRPLGGGHMAPGNHAGHQH